MRLRSAENQATVPATVGVLGALVLVTGWLGLQGLPFLAGCVVTLTLAGCAVALLLTSRTR